MLHRRVPRSVRSYFEDSKQNAFTWTCFLGSKQVFWHENFNRDVLVSSFLLFSHSLLRLLEMRSGDDSPTQVSIKCVFPFIIIVKRTNEFDQRQMLFNKVYTIIMTLGNQNRMTLPDFLNEYE